VAGDRAEAVATMTPWGLVAGPCPQARAPLPVPPHQRAMYFWLIAKAAATTSEDGGNE